MFRYEMSSSLRVSSLFFSPLWLGWVSFSWIFFSFFLFPFYIWLPTNNLAGNFVVSFSSWSLMFRTGSQFFLGYLSRSFFFLLHWWLVMERVSLLDCDFGRCRVPNEFFFFSCLVIGPALTLHGVNVAFLMNAVFSIIGLASTRLMSCS